MNNIRRVVLASLFAAALPFAASAQSSCSKGNLVKVKLTTSMGPIVLELNREKAPVSVDNFVQYVESGHYNGTIFHRVVGDFLIQGGAYTPDMQQKPERAPVPNEASSPRGARQRSDFSNVSRPTES